MVTNVKFRLNHRKIQLHRGAFSKLTLKLQRSAVVCNRVLYDGKTEACAADALGMALVNSVESFEDSFLLTLRYSDAVVQNGDGQAAILLFHKDFYKSALFSVLDAVVHEIVDQLLEDLVVAHYMSLLTLDADAYILALGNGMQAGLDRIKNRHNLYFSVIGDLAAVHLIESYNVTD